MPDVQEVFRMATQKVRPEVGFVDRQLDKQRRSARNRKVGALALVAVIGLIALFAVVLTQARDERVPAGRPSVAPSGSNDPGSAYALDLATGQESALPFTLPDEAMLSPDGTMYVSEDDPELSVANIDGASVRRIRTPHVADVAGASWSPDGSQIVYQGRDLANDGRDVGDLFVADVTTGEVRKITDLERMSAGWWWLNPVFSPDGATVLFQIPRNSGFRSRWDLFSVPVEGGEHTLVRRGAAIGAYSPDGGTLAYLRRPDGGEDYWSSSLWLVDADGSPPRLLVAGMLDEYSWSPDGTRIAYSNDGEVHIVDVATDDETSYPADGGAHWLDDHTLIIQP